MEKTYKTLFVISLLVAVFAIGYIFYCQKNPVLPGDTRTITDTILVDNIRVQTHTITKSTQIVDTFYICKSDTVYLESLPIEHKIYEDTITKDSIQTKIGIYYHGFAADIDTVKVATEVLYAVPLPKRKKWGLVVGPSIYAGYGFAGTLAGPNIGIGVSLSWGYIIK